MFTEESGDMISVFKALGDPTRREILKLLNHGDLTAGEIAGRFCMSKPAITRHLDILRNAELVSSTKAGVNVIYSINLTVLQEALSSFLAYFETGEPGNALNREAKPET